LERVEFVLGFSKILAIFLGLIYVGALIILIFSIPLAVAFKIIGITLLILHFRCLLNLHIRRISKKSIVYIWQDSLGRWGCKTNSGKAAMAELKGDTFKCAVFLIVCFRFKSGTRNVIIPVDALNKHEYRILYARLTI